MRCVCLYFSLGVCAVVIEIWIHSLLDSSVAPFRNCFLLIFIFVFLSKFGLSAIVVAPYFDEIWGQFWPVT